MSSGFPVICFLVRCFRRSVRHGRRHGIAGTEPGFSCVCRLSKDCRSKWPCAIVGWALIGRDSHPLDDELNFVRSSHDSLLSDQQCLVATTKRVSGQE
jgi:hypothetical protein